MNTIIAEQVLRYALDQVETSEVNVLDDITGFGYDSAEYFEYQRTALKGQLDYLLGESREGLSAKDEMVIALRVMQLAFHRLNHAWEAYDLNNMEANELYPFDKSFDELYYEVDDWVRATQFELANN